MSNEVNLIWTVIISLIASVLGGIISGWLVLKKSRYDLKRTYAGQMYLDFVLLANEIFLHIYNHIHAIDANAVANIKPTMGEFSTLSLSSLISRLNKYLEDDLEKKLSLGNKSDVIKTLSILVNESIDGFKKFFEKYPAQIVYFDKLYYTITMIDTLQPIPESRLLNEDIDILSNFITATVPIILGILKRLKDISLEFESFRTAKSWSWRILRV